MPLKSKKKDEHCTCFHFQKHGSCKHETERLNALKNSNASSKRTKNKSNGNSNKCSKKKDQSDIDSKFNSNSDNYYSRYERHRHNSASLRNYNKNGKDGQHGYRNGTYTHTNWASNSNGYKGKFYSYNGSTSSSRTSRMQNTRANNHTKANNNFYHYKQSKARNNGSNDRYLSRLDYKQSNLYSSSNYCNSNSSNNANNANSVSNVVIILNEANLENWSQKEVKHWLENKGFHKFVSYFNTEQINGLTLFATDVEDLRSRFHRKCDLPMGHITELIDQIEQFCLQLIHNLYLRYYALYIIF